MQLTPLLFGIGKKNLAVFDICTTIIRILSVNRHQYLKFSVLLVC